jgi:hypothetical protein
MNRESQSGLRWFDHRRRGHLDRGVSCASGDQPLDSAADRQSRHPGPSGNRWALLAARCRAPACSSMACMPADY